MQMDLNLSAKYGRVLLLQIHGAYDILIRAFGSVCGLCSPIFDGQWFQRL